MLQQHKEVRLQSSIHVMGIQTFNLPLFIVSHWHPVRLLSGKMCTDASMKVVAALLL